MQRREVEIESFRLSPRVVIAAGSLVRVVGKSGPECNGEPMTAPKGVYRVVRLFEVGRRTWAEVVGFDGRSRSGLQRWFIGGRAFRSEIVSCVVYRPYALRRVTAKGKGRGK